MYVATFLGIGSELRKIKKERVIGSAGFIFLIPDRGCNMTWCLLLLNMIPCHDGQYPGTRKPNKPFLI